MQDRSFRGYLRHLSPLDWPYFVSHVRYEVQTKGNPYRKAAELVVTSIMAMCLLRVMLILITLIIDTPTSREWFRFFLIFGNHLLRNESLMLLVSPTSFTILMLMPICIIATHYRFKGLKSEIWMSSYYAAVVNYDQFKKHNSGYLKKLRESTKKRPVTRYLRLLWRLWEGDPEITFKNDKLKTLPGLTFLSRTRLLNKVYSIESFADLASFVACVIIPLVAAGYGYDMIGCYSLPVYLLYSADCCIIAWFFGYSGKFGALCVNQIMLNDNTSIIYFKQITRELENDNLRRSSGELPYFLFLYRIQSFLRRHWSRSRLLFNFNRSIYSFGIYTFAMTQLPPNVYLVAQLLYTEKGTLLYLIFWLTFLAQSILITLALYVIANVSKVVHSPHKQFLTTQRLLPKRNILLKLKWNMYYEMIHTSRKPIAYTAGSLGKITPSSLFQGLSFYIGMLFYSLSIVRSLYQGTV